MNEGGQSAHEIVEEYPGLEEEDIPDCLHYAAWLASTRNGEHPNLA